MTANNRKPAQNHDDILEAIADHLDIPASRFEEAKNRYDAIGEWLNRPTSTLARYQPAISPQGSFLLGTVIRPISDADEYDVDLVCRLQASKTEWTQKQLKQAVGQEVKRYAHANGMQNSPKEGRRCWTLHYADGAQFHMDILPALPDAEHHKNQLLEQGHTGVANDALVTEQAIAITDWKEQAYAHITDDWPVSNPQGYAAWFRQQMIMQLNECKEAYAKLQNIDASVDGIPDHRVRTPLQRAIQLLKRHRDCMFADNCANNKPISIIITTLAAHAYNEEPTIAEALGSILRHMDDYIEERSGESWVENPVNPAENFADKWPQNPAKKRCFKQWLVQAQQDFGHYLRANRFNQMPEQLRTHLGEDAVTGALKAAAPQPAQTDDGQAASAVQTIRQTGPQSKPWFRT